MAQVMGLPRREGNIPPGGERLIDIQARGFYKIGCVHDRAR